LLETVPPPLAPQIHPQKGFTLVQYAIVLVVIGLVLWGVLKGEEMIAQARSKAVIHEMHSISAAYVTYLDRYRAMPGDDGRASSRWTASVSGDGNGTVAGSYEAQPAAATPATSEESNLFWWHLRLSGLIPGPAAGTGVGAQPNNALGSIIGVQTGAGAATMNLSGLIICTANVPAKVAIAVDTQIDDRAAATGSLHGALQSAPNQPIAAATFPPTGGNYAEAAANKYLLCNGL
jgi:hypothetical protein